MSRHAEGEEASGLTRSRRGASLVVVAALAVAFVSVDPVGAAEGDPVGVVDDTVDQVGGTVDDTVDQVSGTVDETTETVSDATGGTTGSVLGSPSGTEVATGQGSSPKAASPGRSDRVIGGTAPTAGPGIAAAEASSPELGRQMWFAATQQADLSQMEEAGVCPNGVDAACLLDALLGASASASEVLGKAFRNLAQTGLGVVALSLLALLLLAAGLALRWSAPRDRRPTA